MIKFYLTSILLTFPFSAAASGVKIDGWVQPWVRSCQSSVQQLFCEIPQPTEAKKRVSLVLPRPSSLSEVSTKTVTYQFRSLEVRVAYYWRRGTSSTKGYISIQTRLFDRKTGKLLSETGQYRSESDRTLIPVGFLATSVVNKKQFGVSFGLR